MASDGPGSITILIGGVTVGEDAASQALWERYSERLVRLARQRLKHARHDPIEDQEDVANKAFEAFLRGAKEGRFPRLNDREDLWRILVCITQRRAIELVRRPLRESTGGTAFGDEDPRGLLDDLAGPEQTPDQAMIEAEEADILTHQVAKMLDELPAAEREVARLKLEGLNNQEIADMLGVVRYTVQRRLASIRRKWETYLARSL